LNLAVSPDKKWLAVTNNGQGKQSVQLIDIQKQVVTCTKEIGRSWYGLAFGKDSKTLYVSGGNDNCILKLARNGDQLQIKDTIALGKPLPGQNISVAGITVDDTEHLLYAVTKENNSLYVTDINSKKILKEIKLPGEAYACLLSPNGKLLYVSCWGCDKVLVFDTQKQEISNSISVGDNPNDMTLNKKGTYLFVSNANDNSVSVIDLKKMNVIETLNSALSPDSPPGSTANSVALSDDEKTLYIANADNNCLSAFDVSSPGNSKSLGFVPVGWYPTCVRIVNKKLYVTNGKGFSSFPNPNGPNPYKKKQKVNYQAGDEKKPAEVQYIASLLKGTLSIISCPDNSALAKYSQQVYNNSPYTKQKEALANINAGNPISPQSSPIKYVFYIIKENRTFDQVLSDVKGGNGDTSLLLFGERITPNQHALAKEFVLFDNFYVDGEVSADGHNWSTGAYATDYLEKTWPTAYGGRGGSYDSEGNRAVANNKNFIWDVCKKAGVSYRTYGEFADDNKPNIPSLKDHLCPYFTGWDESVMDTTRFRQWKKEFDSLLAVNQVPKLNTLRFINDHTEGLRLGRPSPNAHVADNDLATGLFVEHLSKSKIWKESVVFILEDDAQNGCDHVDAHRSTLYVAGGFVKRNYIDHTLYSTSSVLHTIELILGLPPMSQFDAGAEPLWRSFSETANEAPFRSVSSKADLFEKNVAVNKWQKMSEEFDFKKEDRAPDQEFNWVLWWAIKGDRKPCPPPVHSAFIRVLEED
jgi:YVTN family beta-propeller protein